MIHLERQQHVIKITQMTKRKKRHNKKKRKTIFIWNFQPKSRKTHFRKIQIVHQTLYTRTIINFLHKSFYYHLVFDLINDLYTSFLLIQYNNIKIKNQDKIKIL